MFGPQTRLRPSRDQLGKSPQMKGLTRDDVVVPRSRILAPLVFVLIWWCICTTMFVMGWPIPYVRTNVILVVSMIFSCAIFLSVGFICATPKSLSAAPMRSTYSRPAIFGLLASVVLIGPIVSTYSGFALDEVGTALADQGAAFEQSTQRILEGTESRTGLLLVQAALAPFTLVALPFAAIYWFENRRGLPAFLVALGVPVVTSVMVGRDQQVGWSLIVLGATWILSRIRRGIGIRGRDVAAIGAIVAIFSVLFALRKSSRGASGPVCPPGATQCLGLAEDRNIFEAAFQSMSAYMSQGLEGLGRAFNAEWVFGGGLAHSPAVYDLLSRIFGFTEAPTVSTQLGDVEWSATWYWSTAIMSIANDVPWALIPIVFFFLGLLLGSSWVWALREGDFLSLGVFVLTWLCVIYTPQNLQLAASGPTYIGYVVLVTVFLIRNAMRGYLGGPTTGWRALTTRKPTPSTFAR